MNIPAYISDEWASIDGALFEDTKASALSRVGVIDIGSNSVRLVVFDGAARSPAYFFNEKILCGLGRKLANDDSLNLEGKARALAAIDRFVLLCRRMKVSSLEAVATAAVREARDGASFAFEVEARTGLSVRVISGRQEAVLSTQGVLLGWPEAEGIVCDLGGASMELARVKNGAIGKRLSAELGPLKLMAMQHSKKDRVAFIRKTIADLRKEIEAQKDRLYLVGGSWRAIARLDMERRNYPLLVMHEYRMRGVDIRATAHWIEDKNLQKLGEELGISQARLTLVPLAMEILRELNTQFKPAELCLSGYGIREGLLFEQMPQKMRQRDPLIEASRYSERQSARLPGFGMQLYGFIKPLMCKISPKKMRIVKAACILHDVSWRAHPDYRAEVCFENATRANLGGLEHGDRIFLGLALLHRYKNRRIKRFDAMIEILPKSDQDEAKILGKAMRFGSMFAVDGLNQVSRLEWKSRKRELVLRLRDEGRVLFGEVAKEQFDALAEFLAASSSVKKLKNKKLKG